MKKAPGRSRLRTERRQSPDGAEKFSGRRGENLRLARETGRRELRTARERRSPSSGTLRASASRCVVRRVSGNSWRRASSHASADDWRRGWNPDTAADCGEWATDWESSKLGMWNEEWGMVGDADWRMWNLEWGIWNGRLRRCSIKNSSFVSRISLKLTKLAKLSLRSKLTTIEMSTEEEAKTTARTTVVNFDNFDNFERSDNFKKLN